jgi:DNA-binding response OmpR family regulator
MNAQKKILIADDETINLEFFEVMLSKLGFLVEKAADGVEAMEKITRFLPDLILLDNIMPRMSGWELTRILKGNPKYREIPIIMFSALDDVKDKVEGFELGVDDYITKPYNFSEVLARIRAVLRNRELFGQIVARESRLRVAEELSSAVKTDMLDLVGSINSLDKAAAEIRRIYPSGKIGPDDSGELGKFLDLLSEKTGRARKRIAELDARIERTAAEWEDLKKQEIGLHILETRLRESME